jgi:ribonuclease HI
VSEAIGVATNNVAEYRALVAALEAARAFPARRVRIRADSQLLVRQLEGRYKVKQAHLRPYFEQARGLLAEYDDVDLAHVPREENTEADALVNAALDRA